MRIKLYTAEDANNFVKIADKFSCDIDMMCGRYLIDAKSILGILSLALPKEVDVQLHTLDTKIIKQFYEKIKQWETA